MKNLAMAYSVKRKRMASGGMVSGNAAAVQRIKDELAKQDLQKAQNQDAVNRMKSDVGAEEDLDNRVHQREAEYMNHGGIVDAIMHKRKMASGGDVAPEDLHELPLDDEDDLDDMALEQEKVEPMPVEALPHEKKKKLLAEILHKVRKKHMGVK